jgi:hypothetical protein
MGIQVAIIKNEIGLEFVTNKLELEATQNSRVVYLVDDGVALFNIPNQVRYEGMVVFQKENQKYYSLK